VSSFGDLLEREKTVRDCPVCRSSPELGRLVYEERFDPSRLDGLLVGVHDTDGRCQGLGRLEVDDGNLKVLTNRGEGMQGLRLGSLRLDLGRGDVRPVNLRELMFGL